MRAPAIPSEICSLGFLEDCSGRSRLSPMTFLRPMRGGPARLCSRNGPGWGLRCSAAIPMVVTLMLMHSDDTLGSKLPWPFYHDTDSTLDIFKAIPVRHPTLARYEDIRDPQSGETVPMVTVTDLTSDDADKEVIALVFAEHARELITTEVALWLTRALVGDTEEFLQWPAVQAMQADNARHGVGEPGHMQGWTEHILQTTVFKIFPLMNAAGRRQVDNGNFCLRKKLNNVDLNRNYPVAFQKQAAGSQDYGGPRPFSEPESRIIRSQVLANKKPKAYVDVHSGEWALYIPWDSKMMRGEKLPTDTEALLADMNIHCKCMNGPAGSVAGYLALGSSMDYMYDKAGIEYPLTVEVYGPNGLGTLAAGGHPRHLMQAQIRGSPAHLKCLTEYNPHSLELYQDTVAKWVGSFLAMADFFAPYKARQKSGAAAYSDGFAVHETPAHLPDAGGAQTPAHRLPVSQPAVPELDRVAPLEEKLEITWQREPGEIPEQTASSGSPLCQYWKSSQYLAAAAGMAITVGFASTRIRSRFVNHGKRRTV